MRAREVLTSGKSLPGATTHVALLFILTHTKMQEDKRFKEAINRLSSDTKKWLEIKKILEDEIRGHQDIIIYIDKIIKKKEEKMSKLN